MAYASARSSEAPRARSRNRSGLVVDAELTRATGTAERLAALAMLEGVALAFILFLLSLRRARERAGRMVERLETMERADAVHRRMLEAAARRPDS